MQINLHKFFSIIDFVLIIYVNFIKTYLKSSFDPSRMTLFYVIFQKPSISEFFVASLVVTNMIFDGFVDVFDMRFKIEFSIESNSTFSANEITNSTMNREMSFQRICVVELFLKMNKII